MPADLTVIIQGGSFALLAAALIWGGPRVLAAFEKQRQEFTAAIKEMRADHSAAMKEQRADHAAAIDKLVGRHEAWQTATNEHQAKTNAVLSDVAATVRDLAAHVESCPSRRALPVKTG